MRLRSWIVLIALLPALLVPGGLRVCLCLCACMTETVVERSCCSEPAPEEDRARTDASRVQVAAQCEDCAPFQTTAAEMQQLAKASFDFDACHYAPLAPHASIADAAPVLDVARALYATRSSAPPAPWARSFPLLI